MALDEYLKLWQEAKADPDWQNLDPAEQTLLKQRFYQQVIKPLGAEAGNKFLEADNPALALKAPEEETAGRAFGRGFARNLTGTAARALGVGGLSLEEPTAIRPEDVYKTAALETLGEFADPASLLLGFGTSKVVSPLVKQGVSRLVSRGMAPGSAAAIGAAGAGVAEGGIEGGLQAAIEPEVQPGTRARSVLESAALGALFGGAFAAPGAYAAARQAGTPDMAGTTTGRPAQPRGVVPAVTPVPGVTAPAEAAVMTPIGLDLSSIPTDRLLMLNEQMQQDPRFRGVEADAVQAEILRRQEDAATRGFEAQQAAARGQMRQPWSGRLENLPTTGEPLELTRVMNDIASLEQQIQRAAANLGSTDNIAQVAAQQELNTLFPLLDEARARESSIRQRASLPPAEPTSIFQAMPQREAPAAPSVQEAPPVQPAGPAIPAPRPMSVAEFQAAEEFNNRINALLGGPPPTGRPGGEAPAVTPEMMAAAERGGATMVPQLPAKTTTMAELQRREQAQAAQAAALGLVPQQRIIPVDQAATALRKATKAVQDQEEMVKAMRERGAPQDQISAAEDALRAARNEQFSATEDMRTAQAQSRRFAQQEAEALAARVARQKDAAEAKVRQQMQEEAARRAAKRAKKAEQPPAEGGQPPSEGGQPPTGGAQGRRPRTPPPKPPAPKTPKAPAKITEEDLRQAGVLRPDGTIVSNNEAGTILKDATSDLRKANKAFKDNPTEANKAAVDQAKTQVKFADNLQKTLKKYVSQEGAPSPKAGEPETPSTTEQAKTGKPVKTPEPAKSFKGMTDEELDAKARQLIEEARKKEATLQSLKNKAQVAYTGEPVKTPEPAKSFEGMTDEELDAKARQLAKQIEKKEATLQILEDKAQVAYTGSKGPDEERLSVLQKAFDREMDELNRLDEELFNVKTEEKTRANKAYQDELEAKQLAKKKAEDKKAEAAQKKAAAKEPAAKEPAAKEPAEKEPAEKEPAEKEPPAKKPGRPKSAKALADAAKKAEQKAKKDAEVARLKDLQDELKNTLEDVLSTVEKERGPLTNTEKALLALETELDFVKKKQAELSGKTLTPFEGKLFKEYNKKLVSLPKKIITAQAAMSKQLRGGTREQILQKERPVELTPEQVELRKQFEPLLEEVKLPKDIEDLGTQAIDRFTISYNSMMKLPELEDAPQMMNAMLRYFGEEGIRSDEVMKGYQQAARDLVKQAADILSTDKDGKKVLQEIYGANLMQGMLAKALGDDIFNVWKGTTKNWLGPRSSASMEAENLVHNLNLFLPDSFKPLYSDFIEDNLDAFPKEWHEALLNGSSNLPSGTRYREQAKNREALGLSKDVDLAKPIDKMTTPKKGTKRIVKLDDDGNPEVINNPCKD